LPSGACRFGSTTSVHHPPLQGNPTSHHNTIIQPLLIFYRYDTASRPTMTMRFRNKLKNAGRQSGKYLRTAAWQTCKCLLWTVFSPCVCCMILLLPNQSDASRRIRRIEPVKPIMPWPRRRALSITSTDLSKEQTTHAQTQSGFMAKLPLELRRMIYKETFKEDYVHLSLSQGRLDARRCSVFCCTCYISSFREEKTLDMALPLLKTCRRM